MADGPPGYLKTVFEHYDNLSRTAFLRWKDSVREIREGTYEVKTLAKDTLYFWTEGALGLVAPLLVGSPFAAPIVTVEITVGAADAQGGLPMMLPSGGTLAVTALKEAAGVHQIPASAATADFADGNTRLVVKLAGLDTVPHVPVFGERYSGQVTVDGNLLAMVSAPVVPA